MKVHWRCNKCSRQEKNFAQGDQEHSQEFEHRESACSRAGQLSQDMHRDRTEVVSLSTTDSLLLAASGDSDCGGNSILGGRCGTSAARFRRLGLSEDHGMCACIAKLAGAAPPTSPLESDLGRSDAVSTSCTVRHIDAVPPSPHESELGRSVAVSEVSPVASPCYVGTYSFCGVQLEGRPTASSVEVDDAHDFSQVSPGSEVCSPDKPESPMSFTAGRQSNKSADVSNDGHDDVREAGWERVPKPTHRVCRMEQETRCSNNWAYVAVRGADGNLTYHAPPSMEEHAEEELSEEPPGAISAMSAILEMGSGPPAVEIATLACPVPTPQLSPRPHGRAARYEDDGAVLVETRCAPVRVRPPAASSIPEQCTEPAWAWWRPPPQAVNATTASEKSFPSPVMGSRTPFVSQRSPMAGHRSPLVLMETPQVPLIPSRQMKVGHVASPVAPLRAPVAPHPRSPPRRCFPSSQSQSTTSSVAVAPLVKPQGWEESPRQPPGRVLVDDFVLMYGRRTPSFSPCPSPGTAVECPPWLQLPRRQRDGLHNEVHMPSKPATPRSASPPVRASAHGWVATLGGA